MPLLLFFSSKTVIMLRILNMTSEKKADEKELYKAFDPTSIGLPETFKLTNYSKLKG